MTQTTPYIRRTRPRWRLPALILLGATLVLGVLCFGIYAQVQRAERDFMTVPKGIAAATYAPGGPQGDWSVRLRLPTQAIEQAVTNALPVELARQEWTDRTVPFWSLEEVEVALTAVVSRAATARARVFNQELELIQPLRLTLTASTDELTETEAREFILTARVNLDLDTQWQWQLVELEPARILGFAAPRVFGLAAPDLSALTQQLNADLAPQLLDRVAAGLNASASPRGQIEALARTLTVPTLSPDLGSEHIDTALTVVGGHVNEVTLTQNSVEAGLVLSLTAARQGLQPDLPALILEPKQAEDFVIPVPFAASFAEIEQLLAQNQRLLRVAGGALTPTSIKLVRPHGDALLLRAEAREIDPGGHRFRKRGAFHVLAHLRFHGPTQTLRLVDATPAGPIATNSRLARLALRGQEWLASPALAQGLIGGLDGLTREDAVRAYLSALETALDATPQLQGQSLGQVRLTPMAATYAADSARAYVEAQTQPQLVVSF